METSAGGNQNVLVLYPSTLKRLGLLVVCLAFCGLGTAAAIDRGHWLGWLCVIFFGLGAVAVAVELVLKRSCLVLNEHGFEIRSALRHDTYAWDDVERFGIMVVQPGGARFVAMKLRPAARSQGLAGHLSNAMSGYDGALPDSYCNTVDDLVSLMTEWKQRYSRVQEATGP